MTSTPVVIHAIPGRLRLRAPWLRGDSSGAALVAERLGELGGMQEVAINPHTGSVLCSYEPTALEVARILDALQAEAPPAAPPVESASNGVARATARIFRSLDRQMLAATEGRIDLGTVITVALLGAGATEVVAKRELPAPPWFTLAWWAFRTFVTLEGQAIAESHRG